VFTIRGAGTVATGTLTGGPLALGDEVEIHPSGARARIRGLQSHQRSLEVARPVSRVAANLAGVERGLLERGDVLTRPGEWRPTTVLEAHLVPVRSSSKPVTARGAFALHAGATERAARVRLYGTAELPAGGAFARIRLAAPLVLEVGDRFVIRESGRRETVAGGVVLDVDPPSRPGPNPADRLAVRRAASPEALPSLILIEEGAVSVSDLAALTGLRPTDVAGARPVGSWWVSLSVLAAVERELSGDLARFHEADALAAGMPDGQVRAGAERALRDAGAPGRPELAGALVDDLIQRGVLARDGARIRLASHVATAPTEDEARLVHAVSEREPTPPTMGELLGLGFGRSLIDASVRSGTLVRISPELVVTAPFVERAVAAIGEAGEAGITVSVLRERLGTSRKYAVPLLEHLDQTGVTRRSGDVRILRQR
jgi:selenocysteine-specific elongation factor